MSGTSGARRADGRRVMDPRCAKGHHSQAMECPDCYEQLYPGEIAGPEWRAWYDKRYSRPRAVDGASSRS